MLLTDANDDGERMLLLPEMCHVLPEEPLHPPVSQSLA